jgi:AcrR family transcriptional regulator
MPRKSERTRSRIVEAANHLFYRKGYNRTSFSDVVESAGVPRGNIYYYFKTKDDILRAAVQYRLERIKAMLENWSGTFRTPQERLKRFLEILPNSASSLARHGCPMGTLNMELGKDQPELKAEAKQMFDLFEGWLADQFAELGYAGRARELAMRLLAQGQGVTMVTHVYNDTAFLARETARLERWIDRLAAGDDSCD